jgi:hypothetical protein
MELNSYKLSGLTNLSNDELQNTNGGFIGFLIVGGLLLTSAAARTAIVGAVVLAASHVAGDGYKDGYKSAH